MSKSTLSRIVKISNAINHWENRLKNEVFTSGQHKHNIKYALYKKKRLLEKMCFLYLKGVR